MYQVHCGVFTSDMKFRQLFPLSCISFVRLNYVEKNSHVNFKPQNEQANGKELGEITGNV